MDEGAPMVPLIQIVYKTATVYRMFVRTRGVMVLAEVGIFTVPMHLSAVADFQASIQVLEWFK
ncbi:hypothetical protein BGZ80_005269, partial [Entomortierella chlamydospora]